MNFTKHTLVMPFLSISALLCTTVLLFFLGNSAYIATSAQAAATSAPTADPAVLSHIQALVTPTTNCNLPCFWGFQSENATLPDIKQFVKSDLSDITLSEETYPDQDYSTPQFKVVDYAISIPIYGFSYNALEDGGLRVYFATHDDKLFYTLIEFFKPRSEWLPKNMFDLSNAIKTLGQPTNVYVRIQGPYPPTFVWTLDYEDKGILVQYEFDFSDPWGQQGGYDPIMMCPLSDHVVAIRAWLQRGSISGLLKDHLAPSSADWSLEKMANIGISQFAKSLLADSKYCLAIVSRNELLKEQYPFQ